MDNGTFYALGVGPGDPELLTRKACRILSGCPVIAAPRTASGEMLALDIAKGAVDLTGKEILPLEFAMARQVSARQTGYRKAAEQIAAVLESGRDVAMVNLGDVSIYATAYYVLDVVRSMGFRTEMVPGVPSFCAVAALLQQSLTVMRQPLHIIPGGHGNLEEHLSLPGTKVLMKSGKSLPEVRETLDKLGLSHKASLVQNCGLPDEKVCRDLAEGIPEAGYFTTIVIKE